MGRFKKATGWLDSLTDHRYFKRGAAVTAVTGAGAITLVKVGIGVVVTLATVFLGLLGHIPAFYLVAGGIWVFGAVLWTMNQFAVRQANRLTSGSASLAVGLPSSVPSGQSSAQPISVKQPASAVELAQPVIQDRLVRVTEIPRDRDGWIRHKTFVDCDLIGPAVIYVSMCTFTQVSIIGGPPSTSMEAVLWPINPRATALVGAVAMFQCAMQRGRCLDIGWAGDTAFLDVFRRSVLHLGGTS